MFAEELDQKTYDEFIKTLNILNTLKSPLIIDQTTPFLADGFSRIEEKDELVIEVLSNARTYVHFRKFSADMIDIEYKKENIKRGIMGYIWGANIIVRKAIPDNTVILLSESRNATILQFENVKNKDLISNTVKLNKEINDLLKTLKDKQNQFSKILYELTMKEEKNIESK